MVLGFFDDGISSELLSCLADERLIFFLPGALAEDGLNTEVCSSSITVSGTILCPVKVTGAGVTTVGRLSWIGGIFFVVADK